MDADTQTLLNEVNRLVSTPYYIDEHGVLCRQDSSDWVDKTARQGTPAWKMTPSEIEECRRLFLSGSKCNDLRVRFKTSAHQIRLALRDVRYQRPKREEGNEERKDKG